MQSICNQLLYEQAWNQRKLEMVKFVWMERDPQVMDNFEAIRRHGNTMDKPRRRPSIDSVAQSMFSAVSHSVSIANTLLAFAGQDEQTTDKELEQQYHFDETSFDLTSSRKERQKRIHQTLPTILDNSDGSSDETIVLDDFEVPSILKKHNQVLDMQVCITSKDVEEEYFGLPFVHKGRPDLEQIFMDMRIEAISRGERRVAVCMCAPLRLVHICHKLAIAHSCDRLTFDFHEEVFS